MKVNPYLNFNGNCREAFEFYHRTLGGNLEAMFTFADMPAAADVPPEAANQIMHASLRIGADTIMGSDAPGEMYTPPAGTYVSLHIPELDNARSVFNALAEGGNVQMPFEETFWAKGFGMCVDRFGTPWMVNCEKPQ